MPLRVVVAMLTAMLLTRPKRGVNVYRTLFFMPSLAPTVGSALVFVYLLNPSTGPVDQLLSKIPGVGTPLWFYDPTLGQAGAGRARPLGDRRRDRDLPRRTARRPP